MNDKLKERLMIVITTLAGMSCLLQSIFGGWEFWVPGVIVIGMLLLWWVYLTKKLDRFPRITLYFTFSAFLLFYHGAHESSLFDVSVAFALFISTVTVADRVVLLNLGIIEYFIVMAIQLYFIFSNSETDINTFLIMRITFHVVAIIVLYLFARITVTGRLMERNKMDDWRRSVDANNRDMEDFLSNVSHELRTPVNVITGMATLLQKNHDCDEILAIRDAGFKLASQIEDIQDYMEIKRGEIILEEERYSCISLINDIVTNFNAKYKDRGKKLVVDLATDTPAMLSGDIKKLQKIFRHLIDNAVKFTIKGCVNVKVFSVKRGYGINLVIEITDTGIGMSRADIARVSNGLYQANKQRTRSTGGIGIGLPIVYGFAHAMGGFVVIDSKKRSGTTVRVSIPQGVVDPSPCLELEDKGQKGLVFFIKPDKYEVPEMRDFVRAMAANLATGLNVKLYFVSEIRELEGVIRNVEISHIFTAREEYEADIKDNEQLSREGYKIIVADDIDSMIPMKNGVLMMPRPMYAVPVVQILNGEIDKDDSIFHEEERPRFTGVRALIVDDEPMNLVVAAGLIREYGMNTDAAESGKEAIRKCEDNDYDIIFMDHMMPEMDGVEAMKKIREIAVQKGKKPAIVALTANALSGAREMFMKEGFDGFIAKPIDIKNFERVVKNVLPEDMIHYEGRDEA
ncbi:MAG: response regulator [Butyrivibrio sp.]|nr:response regulator [Butyrivibrio sp.]